MDITEEVTAYLFAERNAQTYAILDGASINELLAQLYKYEPEFECLYRGELNPDLAEVAPYLVRLDRESAFTDWVVGEGWGNHWGIFAVAKADLPSLRRHFRRFLTVHNSDGKPMLFRYYDPRVFRAYLPTCSVEELGLVFGQVFHYILEGGEPNELLRYQLTAGALVSHKKQITNEA